MELVLSVVRHKLVLMMMVVSLSAVPFSSHALTFAEAYQALLQNNLSYRRAQLDYQADQTLVSQARAELLPNISVSGSTGYVRNDIERLEDPELPPPAALENEDDLDLDGETRRREEYAIRLSQTLYNRTLSSRVKQAKSQVLESELRLQRVLEQQLGGLSDAYFGYLQAMADMEIAKRELESVNEHRMLTIERQKIGLGTSADVHEAVSRYKVAQVELLEDIKSKELFAGRLQRLLQRSNLDIGAKRLHFQRLTQEPEQQDVQQLIEQFLESNIEVELQRRLVESARLALRADKAIGWPTLDLTASSGRSETDALEVGDESSTRDDRVMLELNIPLFAGFRKSAKVKESSFRYAAEQVELDNTIATQTEAIAEAYRAKQTAYKKMLAFEQSFTSADDALVLRQEGYLEGLVSSLDVLNAYRDKHRSERSWVGASFEYITAIIRLNIVLGRVDFQDLRQVDVFLTDAVESRQASDNKKKAPFLDQKSVVQKNNAKTVSDSDKDELRQFLTAWQASWEQGNSDIYLSFYAEHFQLNENQSYADWRLARKARVIPEKAIRLQLEDIVLKRLSGDQPRYEVMFVQHYEANDYRDVGNKVLIIEKFDDVLKIVTEKST